MATLEIISDVICPWCYIGKARFDAALANSRGNPFEIEWKIFQLNPDMPPEGMDRTAYLEAKFGGPDGAKRVYGAIEQAAEESGLHLRFDLIKRTPNSMDAHRLIRWSRITGDQSAVVAQLFARYFERGEDISDHDLLLEVAVQAGMEKEVVARLLASGADREILMEEDDAARRMGVTGVPTFMIAGKYVVQGAQDAETWTRIIAEINETIAAPAMKEARQ